MRAAGIIICCIALAGCASQPVGGGIEEVGGAVSLGPFVAGRVKLANPQHISVQAEVPEGDTYLFVIGRDKPAPNFNIGSEDPRAKSAPPLIQYSPPPPSGAAPSYSPSGSR